MIKFNITAEELWFWRITVIGLLLFGIYQEVEITRLYKMISQQIEQTESQIKVNEKLIRFDNNEIEINNNYNKILLEIADRLQ